MRSATDRRVGAVAWSEASNPLALTDLEVAAGDLTSPGRSVQLSTPPTGGPVEVLERLLVGALAQPPCCLAFSGGRDSSALLALAAGVARREGLPRPVALTTRWPGDVLSEESAWQEHVVSSVGVEDWEIIYPGDQLDLLGPVATAVLTDQGLLWPPPSYVLYPLMQRAAGGTLVTGEGGDEVFGLWAHASTWESLRKRKWPGARSLGALGVAILPSRARELLCRNSVSAYQDWLLPDAKAMYERQLAAAFAQDAPQWPRYLAQILGSRDLALAAATRSAMSARARTTYQAPFLEAPFLSAMGKVGGHYGIGNRSMVMRRTFGGILPDNVLTRVSKATFGDVFWGKESRDFARTWDGEGVDRELVDVDKLRRAWLADRPVFGCALALHAAWLVTNTETVPSRPSLAQPNP